MSDRRDRILETVPDKMNAQLVSLEAIATALEKVVDQQRELRIDLLGSQIVASSALRSIDASLHDVARGLRFLVHRTALLERTLLSDSTLESLDLSLSTLTPEELAELDNLRLEDLDLPSLP